MRPLFFAKRNVITVISRRDDKTPRATKAQPLYKKERACQAALFLLT